ncbi:MAG: DUF3047 domain-containing protein [Desulfurivibrionaceae bacterium]|nr:DUF3047 domain-containing protein [Desulfobulbales bacterium]MDT8335887.1 DUF3047 domain-containing protein [Desulfurivibrionaceae bacterium]
MKSPLSRPGLINSTVTAIIAIMLGASWVHGEVLLIDDFKDGIRPGWQVKKFEGLTAYTSTVEEGIPCLKATAEGTASGLFYEIEYDPRQKPILTWKWKIDNIVKSGDARTKKGDDYAARIYVLFPSFFFWKTKAINYVWANRLPKGAAIASSYTANAMVVAVESGPAETGKWLEYRRDIYEDYRKYFHSTPGKVGAIAIMTDTDTTGEKASACYGPIGINSR